MFGIIGSTVQEYEAGGINLSTDKCRDKPYTKFNLNK